MFTGAPTCTPQADPSRPTCTAAGSSGLYVSSDCTDSYPAFLDLVFSDTPRVVTELFGATDADKCGILQGIVAYVADTECYASLDTKQASFRVTLGKGDGTATVELFDAANCPSDKVPTVLAVTKADFDDHLCQDDNSIKFVFGGTAPTGSGPGSGSKMGSNTGSSTGSSTGSKSGATPGPTSTTQTPSTTTATPAATTATPSTATTGSGKSGTISSFSVSAFASLVTATAVLVGVTLF
ncbi:hypothetical protein ON010_g18384 [Phytophthora cinnamomi]|nr:hypothetical protein ON010_g18384 [Phytophthora cinnamomi]